MLNIYVPILLTVSKYTISHGFHFFLGMVMYVQAGNTRLLSSSVLFLYSLQTELLNAVLSGDALHTDSILRSARVDVDERLKVCTYS